MSYASETRIGAEMKACFRVLNAILYLLSKFHSVLSSKMSEQNDYVWIIENEMSIEVSKS